MANDLTPENGSKKKTKSLLASFSFAFAGIWYAIRSQRNMRIHLGAAVVATGVGIWVELDAVRSTILCLTITLVLVLEIMNTALERLVDLVSPEYRLSAKRTKDLAAGAVLIAAICSVVVGLFLFLPAIVEKFSVR